MMLDVSLRSPNTQAHTSHMRVCAHTHTHTMNIYTLHFELVLAQNKVILKMKNRYTINALQFHFEQRVSEIKIFVAKMKHFFFGLFGCLAAFNCLGILVSCFLPSSLPFFPVNLTQVRIT